jgi:ariadne-1
MDCSHTFCNDCWKQHISVQVRDGNAKGVVCMAFKCGMMCDEDKVTNLIKGNEQVRSVRSK